LLTHPTLELMHQLGFNGMAKAFSEIEASGEGATLTHPEWLALLLDREATYRRDRRLRARLRYARLRHQAAIEDVDYRATRGLDRALFNKLVEGVKPRRLPRSAASSGATMKRNWCRSSRPRARKARLSVSSSSAE